MASKVYSTGSTQGSRIPYPGGIPAPDIKMIKSRVQRAAEGSVEDHLKRAIARATASIVAPEVKCAGGRDSVRVDSDGNVHVNEAAYTKCCAEQGLPTSLCRAAIRDAKATFDILNAMPGVGHIFSWVSDVGKKKRQAWSLNKKREFTNRVYEYLLDESDWVRANALIKLGYADLLAFLSDCRAVTTKGIYNTRGGRGRNTHRVVPYMKWHGSEHAKWHFDGWLKWLRLTNRARMRVRRGEPFGSPDGVYGQLIGHDHGRQEWLLQNCYPHWAGARHCAASSSSGAGGLYTPDLAADKCFPDSAPTGEFWRMWPLGLMEAGGQFDYQRSRAARTVLTRLKNSKTVKDLCKSGMGGARYDGGDWYSTGSVEGVGTANTPGE